MRKLSTENGVKAELRRWRRPQRNTETSRPGAVLSEAEISNMTEVLDRIKWDQSDLVAVIVQVGNANVGHIELPSSIRSFLL